MKYKIVYGETPEALEKNVLELIADGWTPKGGIAVYMGVVYQALVKD